MNHKHFSNECFIWNK